MREVPKAQGKPAGQMMAHLPRIRVKETKSILSTSCRFCFPFFNVQERGKPRKKGYLCVFLTCLLSRAVHLEVAFGTDTYLFLNTFCGIIKRMGLLQG